MNYLAIGLTNDILVSTQIFPDDDICFPDSPKRIVNLLNIDHNAGSPTYWDQLLLVEFDTNNQAPQVIRHWTYEDLQ